MKFKLNLLTALLIAASSSGAFACASCGCSLNTDLQSQGMSSNPGWTFDLRYDYLNQNQLRSGTGTISNAAAVSTINPKILGTTTSAEVEGYTRNNYLTSTLDYNNGETWGATVILPFIQRDHMTFGTNGTQQGGVWSGGGWPSGTNGYTSHASGFGDVKVIGRYFGFSEEKNWGLQFGVKLPTGDNGQTAASYGGGLSAVDPGLQLGTGSTDLIVGAYRFGHIQSTENWGYFGNVQFQVAVDPKSTPVNIDALGGGGSYRPGNSLNLNGGVNYQGFDRLIPTIQFNFIDKKADTGVAADTWSTGGTLIYLTPGLLFSSSDSTQYYANVQLPLYQNLNGIQLAPTFVGSVGVRIHF